MLIVARLVVAAIALDSSLPALERIEKSCENHGWARSDGTASASLTQLDDGSWRFSRHLIRQSGDETVKSSIAFDIDAVEFGSPKSAYSIAVSRRRVDAKCIETRREKRDEIKVRQEAFAIFSCGSPNTTNLLESLRSTSLK